jgi:malate synthase
METLVNQNKTIRLSRSVLNHHPQILTQGAFSFLEALHHNFNNKRLELLDLRAAEQAYFDAGNFPVFHW